MLNNRIEGIGIRSFTVGRKNWLFANTTRGAHSSANIYSIVESAKLKGLDVFKYLTYVLECLKKDQSKETIQRLLPYTKEMKEKFKK